MYSNFNNETIQKGRKKVYSATEKLELLLPNGKNDGFLEKDDLIYLVQKIRQGDKIIFRFRVIKFADTKNESKIYTGEKKYFKPYFEPKEENKSNLIGDFKKNYKVPFITTLGGGVLGYFLGQKYQKTILMTTLGVGIGLVTGIFLLKYSKDKKEKKENEQTS